MHPHQGPPLFFVGGLEGPDTWTNSVPPSPPPPRGASLFEWPGIPNVEFKLDVTHCYKGWKISRPYACSFGFAHVLNLAALDVGLLLYLSRRRGHKRVPVEAANN